MISVFISYSTDDRAIAKRLHKDLRAEGAEVFQFEQTARPGDPAWSQVDSAIKKCTYFLVLASPSSSGSKPVAKEIEWAIHRRINDEDNLPNIIPLLLRTETPLPPMIGDLTQIDFSDYALGYERLKCRMQLARGMVGTAAEHVVLEAVLEAVPDRPLLGEPVKWKASVHNKGDVPLEELVMRLGPRIVEGPRTVLARTEIQKETMTVYESPGRRRRQLLVEARLPNGNIVQASAVRKIRVKAGIWQAQEAVPAMGVVRATKAAAPVAPDVAAKRVTPPSVTRHKDDIPRFPAAYHGGSVLPVLAWIALTGMAATAAFHEVAERIVAWYRTLDSLPGWLMYAPQKVSHWPPFLAWLGGLWATIKCFAIGFGLREELVSGDNGLGAAIFLTVFSTICIGGLALVGSFLVSEGLSDSALALFPTVCVGCCCAGLLWGVIDRSF